MNNEQFAIQMKIDGYYVLLTSDTQDGMVAAVEALLVNANMDGVPAVHRVVVLDGEAPLHGVN